MKVKKFEELVAWQKAQELAVFTYKQFKSLKDYSFRDQISRAVVAISSNIAEGFDRSSDADFARFLYIAIASCSEVKSLTYLAEKLDYISQKQADELLLKSNEVSKIIRGLIKSIK